MMREMFVTFAKYNREANQSIVSILKDLSQEEREKDRGSFYKSLSGLLAHVLGGTVFFLRMFKAAVSHNAAAVEALAPLDAIVIPRDRLSGDQWNQFAADVAAADDALVNFTTALTDADMKAPVTLEWYGGNPPSVPLAFMLQQLTVHGTHHRGQISQILDALSITNDYSGINVTFLSP
ncbi:MAG: DinB family protein [Spirochaetaceae bacterium]|jgi:uncharacterized damage-inducible protein DinB|nr:DinB family protein [Spirochaetaceae bacterium]